MKFIQNYKDYLIVENHIDDNSIKHYIGDILFDLKDENPLIKTSVKYDEKGGMKFYEILLYSDKKFTRDKNIITVIRSISTYLAYEYDNPFLDIQKFNINNNHFYRTDGDAFFDYSDSLWKFYFGFIVNEHKGYYLSIPNHWHHNYAKKTLDHTIDRYN
jgi:hypothetical protein